MWECNVTVEVEAPIAKADARLQDFTGHSDFSNGLAVVEKTTPGPVRVGSQFRAEETVPSKFVSFSEITALEEPRLIAWKAWVPNVMRTSWEFRLESSGPRTLLSQVSRWEAAGPIGLVMLNLQRKRNVPRENQEALERIKHLIESESKNVEIVA